MAKLVDLVLDLHDQYGGAQPKPAGPVVGFTVVAQNTTYPKARAGIEALLHLYNLRPASLVIDPGPDVKEKFNRKISFTVPRTSLVVGQI